MSNSEGQKLITGRKRTIKDRFKEEHSIGMSQLPKEITNENTRGNCINLFRFNANVTRPYAFKCF